MEDEASGERFSSKRACVVKSESFTVSTVTLPLLDLLVCLYVVVD